MAQKTLLTAEQFYRDYSGREGRYELVRGEVVEMTPPGWEHGWIVSNIVRVLSTFVREHDLGRVVVESGYRLERRPDTVRGPDVSFVRKERLSKAGKGFFPGAPDLAVEVVSPSDTASMLAGKVRDYQRAGVEQTWLFYPEDRQVQVCPRGGAARWYGEDDTLEGGDLLPGFAMPVREFFK